METPQKRRYPRFWAVCKQLEYCIEFKNSVIADYQLIEHDVLKKNQDGEIDKCVLNRLRQLARKHNGFNDGVVFVKDWSPELALLIKQASNTPQKVTKVIKKKKILKRKRLSKLDNQLKPFFKEVKILP